MEKASNAQGKGGRATSAATVCELEQTTNCHTTHLVPSFYNLILCWAEPAADWSAQSGFLTERTMETAMGGEDSTGW